MAWALLLNNRFKYQLCILRIVRKQHQSTKHGTELVSAMSDHFPDFSLAFFRFKIKREILERVSRQVSTEELNIGL